LSVLDNLIVSLDQSLGREADEAQEPVEASGSESQTYIGNVLDPPEEKDFLQDTEGDLDILDPEYLNLHLPVGEQLPDESGTGRQELDDSDLSLYQRFEDVYNSNPLFPEVSDGSIIGEGSSLADLLPFIGGCYEEFTNDIVFGIEGVVTSSVIPLVPGIGVNDPGWSDGLESVRINDQGFEKVEVVWNTSDDDISDNWFSFKGLFDYVFNPVKREEIKDRVYAQLIEGQKNAEMRGVPLDIASHSWGTKIVYDLLREHPELRVRNFVTMGSPLNIFGAEELGNIDNWINVYNRNDIINQQKDFIESMVLAPIYSAMPFLNMLGDIDIIPDPVGPLGDMNPQVDDSEVTTEHTDVWSDEQVLDKIEEKWKGQ
jgi:hypothetical protein